MTTDIVHADTRAREILQETLEYVLRTDGYHYMCHNADIHLANCDLDRLMDKIKMYYLLHFDLPWGLGT